MRILRLVPAVRSGVGVALVPVPAREDDGVEGAEAAARAGASFRTVLIGPLGEAPPPAKSTAGAGLASRSSRQKRRTA
jgi:hypothetical protein